MKSACARRSSRTGEITVLRNGPGMNLDRGRNRPLASIGRTRLITGVLREFRRPTLDVAGSDRGSRDERARLPAVCPVARRRRILCWPYGRSKARRLRSSSIETLVKSNGA
jgi:hypothetical protein